MVVERTAPRSLTDGDHAVVRLTSPGVLPLALLAVLT